MSTSAKHSHDGAPAPYQGRPSLPDSLGGGTEDVERGRIFAIRVWTLCHHFSIQNSLIL